jgi:hypothetical protein
MRVSFSLCLPLMIATAVACSGDTSYAGPASSLTVLGGNAASPTGTSVAHFEAPRSVGTPKAEVVRVRHSGGIPKPR